MEAMEEPKMAALGSIRLVLNMLEKRARNGSLFAYFTYWIPTSELWRRSRGSHQMGPWASPWQMKLKYVEKWCTLEGNTLIINICWWGSELAKTKRERDLGVVLSVWKQWKCKFCARDYWIQNKPVNIVIPLNRSMVQLYLEYCVRFWSL